MTSRGVLWMLFPYLFGVRQRGNGNTYICVSALYLRCLCSAEPQDDFVKGLELHLQPFP